MLIHLGGDTVVNLHDVIGIFDIHIQESPETKPFVERSKEEKTVEIVEPGEVKSCVITDSKVYYSPISSATLKKRAFAMNLSGKFVFD
jgi:extracellular matrix regulatory protein B